jgi:hypothetical protein
MTKDPNYEDLVHDERRTLAMLFETARSRRRLLTTGASVGDLTQAGQYLGLARTRIEQPWLWRCAPLLLAACRAQCRLAIQTQTT